MSEQSNCQAITQLIGNHNLVVSWTENGIRVGLYRGEQPIGAVMDFGTPKVELAGPVCDYVLSRPNDGELSIVIEKDGDDVQELKLAIEQRSVRILEDKARYDRPELN